MAHAWMMKELVRAYRIDKTETDDHGAVKRFSLIPIVIYTITIDYYEAVISEFPAVFYIPSQAETLMKTGLVYKNQVICQIAHPSQVFADAEFIARRMGNSWIWYRVIGRAERALVGKVWGWEMTLELHEGEDPLVEGT